ncbi:MAG: efflux RND transporter periplasmic adaptor subunit [Proteobacteria bacterium]|nr:efflux RND transporter periplasmic adaptor subunit [Pseudomonadota bacterium]
MTDNRHSSIGIHGLHAHEGAQGIHRLRLLKRTRNVALVGLAVLGAGLAGVVVHRAATARDLATAAEIHAARHVSVVSPKDSSSENVLSLPGTLQGYTEAPIYARTSGYLAAWYKDIGDGVKQGELLARIDTPEVAQQLVEARQAHAQAVAALALAKSSVERWEGLRKLDSVSQQEVEERRNAYAQATAANALTAATVQRLQKQLDYNQVVAPFAGVITKRTVDVGNLIDAGGSSKQLFVLTRSDPLRIYVQVPQGFTRRVQPGDKASVSLAEWPGRVFSGSIVRTAKAIDTASRTLQVEINLPNPKGELLPGAYARVDIKAPATAGEPSFRIPSNTLLFRPEGPRVALVGSDGKVHLQPVTIKRELGVEVELGSGVKADDRIVLNPADSLAEGDAVVVAPPADKKPEAKKAG